MALTSICLPQPWGYCPNPREALQYELSSVQDAASTFISRSANNLVEQWPAIYLSSHQGTLLDGIFYLTRMSSSYTAATTSEPVGLPHTPRHAAWRRVPQGFLKNTALCEGLRLGPSSARGRMLGS